MFKKFYHTVAQKTLNLNWVVHFVLATVAFGLYRWTNIVLDASYADSQFPVPYFEGQTSFDGGQIKEWYAFMIEQGTLEIYWRTQLIDFAFIGSVILMGIFLPSFIARWHRDGSWLQKITLWLMVIMPFGAVVDAIENLISFTMLAQPETFANWVAIPYSAFAVMKFAALMPSISWMMLSAGLAFILFGWRWLRHSAGDLTGVNKMVSG